MAFELETFFFDTPIYDEEKIINQTESDFRALFYYSNKRDMEGYNPYHKVLSTFSIEQRLTYSEQLS